jgi:hypothetical protein
MTGHPLVLSDGKMIGRTFGLTAILPVTSRNFLAVAGGYSIDAGVLQAIEVRGCQSIEFHSKPSGRVFRISVKTFRENAEPYDWGYGVKLAAPDSLYEVVQEMDKSNG